MRTLVLLTTAAVGSEVGCARYPGTPAPASPRTLACSLNELIRLGYHLLEPLDGSGWHQASRILNGSGETIWIRMVDDGRRPPWFDIRVSGWDQFQRTGSPERIQVQPSGLQGREDVRTAMDSCK